MRRHVFTMIKSHNKIIPELYSQSTFHM